MTNAEITEMVYKAIPLKNCNPETCSIDRAQLLHRRENLIKSIVSLLDARNADTHRDSGNAGATAGKVLSMQR